MAEPTTIVDGPFPEGGPRRKPGPAPRHTEPFADVPPTADGPPTADTFGGAVVPAEKPPARVGLYHVGERIGGGGMGEVYRAEQLEPIRRDAAVKFIRADKVTPAYVARFKAECQTLALMDHPHIAKVFDAGTAGGRPYLVMEYVRGTSITEYADEHRLSIPDRLALFEQVCQAVQHAHRRGIIHRDIKPSNVLVSNHEGVAFAKVIDFGIAKAAADRPGETEAEERAGTWEYMSPEQATGGPDVDTRTDVYSLGVLLYELLTGSTPFTTAELRAAAGEGVRRMIAEVEPPPPSRRLSTGEPTLPSLAASRRVEPRRLGPAVRGELDWIVMKALDKDRRRRYETPLALAADIAAHLEGKPVLAAPPGAAYRLWKFARRHRGPLAGAAAVSVALAAGLAGVVWQEFRNRETVRDAEAAELRAELAEQGRDRARERAGLVAREAAGREYVGIVSQLAGEEQARSRGWAERSWALLERVADLETPVKDPAALRSAAAAVLVADEFRTRPDWTWPDRVTAAAYASDGERLVIGGRSPSDESRIALTVVEAESGRRLSAAEASGTRAVVPADNDGLSVKDDDVCRVAWADADRAVWALTNSGRVLRGDPASDRTPAEVWQAPALGKQCEFTATADGRYVVVGVPDGPVRVWEAGTGRALPELPETPNRVGEVGYLPDPPRLLVHTAEGTRWVSLPDMAVVRAAEAHHGNGPLHPAGEVYVADDGKSDVLATVEEGTRGVRFRDSGRDELRRTDIAATDLSKGAPAFSLSGRTFAKQFTSIRDDGVEVWDGLGGPRRARITPPEMVLGGWLRYALDPRDRRVALISEKRLSQFSRLRPRLALYRAFGHPSGVRHVATSPDGSGVLMLGERRKDGGDAVYAWASDGHSDGLRRFARWPVGTMPVEGRHLLSVSPDGRWVVAGGSGRPKGVGIVIAERAVERAPTVLSVPDEARTDTTPYFNAGKVSGFGWTDRGRLVAAIQQDLLAWDLTADPPRLVARHRVPDSPRHPTQYAAIDLRGEPVGWGATVDGRLRSFRVGDAAFEILRETRLTDDAFPQVLRRHRSGDWLVVGMSDGTLRLVATDSLTVSEPDVRAHADAVEALCWFGPDRLITGSRGGTLAVWDAAAGALTLRHRLELRAAISDLCPAPEPGTLYVACGEESSVRVLDLAAIDAAHHELGL